MVGKSFKEFVDKQSLPELYFTLLRIDKESSLENYEYVIAKINSQTSESLEDIPDYSSLSLKELQTQLLALDQENNPLRAELIAVFIAKKTKPSENTNSENISADSNTINIGSTTYNRSTGMELGDIFNIVFNLFKVTFSRNIIVILVFLIPAGIALGYGYQFMFSGISETAAEVTTEFESQTSTILYGLIYLGSFMVFLIGYLVANIAVIKISGEQMEGKKIGIGEALNEVFSLTFFKWIGQVIIIGLAVGAIILLITIVSVILGMIHDLMTVLIVLLVIAGICALIFLMIKWAFAQIALVIENLGVFDGLTKSYNLTNGYFWRTLGILILVSISVQFAVTLISTPIIFIVMWDFISAMFVAGSTGLEPDPNEMVNMMSNFGLMFGMTIGITTALQMLIAPLFHVVMYFDLRIRKNEFVSAVNDESVI